MRINPSSPRGSSISRDNASNDKLAFTSCERDTETGNDDFGARSYSNRFGRWLSADWSSVPTQVPYANLTNPQTLNLYSMVGDDPESFADLDGHCVPFCQVVAWIASHIAQVGLQDAAVRKAYAAAAKTATPAQRDALKVQARDSSSPFGRAIAEKAAQDPSRVASRAAKTTEQLAESAGRTSSEFNALASKVGTLGKVSAVVAVTAAVAEVATAPEGKKGEAAAGAATGTGSAILGGEVGGTLGFLVGGPVGAGLGGLAGAALGGYLGDKGGREIYNDIKNPAQRPDTPIQPIGIVTEVPML